MGYRFGELQEGKGRMEREMERVYKKSFQRVLLLRESEKWGSIRSENCNQKKVFKKQ